MPTRTRSSDSPTAADSLPYGRRPPGYRLPDATRIGRVRLAISDLEQSLDFYERVLGFRTVERSGSVVRLGARGGDEVLIELHEGVVRPVPRNGRLGLYHFAILLPDRAALGGFLAHLGEIGAYAGMSDHLVSEALYLRDPDGLGIEVYADRPRDSWRHEGRELAMATAPLDAASVIGAANDVPWNGMPAGTTIGHVHLHVGDLDQAAAFYHRGLGFDEVVWSYPSALFLSAGGYHHHLGTNTWAANAAPAGEGDARLLDWELILPDPASVQAAMSSLEGAGYKVEAIPRGGVVRDPWGTALRLQARTP